MNLDADLDVMFSDNGICLLAVHGADTAWVYFDMPGEEIFGGMQQSTEYAITYRSNKLPNLASGDSITVDGSPYQVRQPTPQEDGKIIKVMLEK